MIRYTLFLLTVIATAATAVAAVQSTPDAMVAAGQLVRPVGPEIRTKDGYYLGTFEGSANRPEVRVA